MTDKKHAVLSPSGAHRWVPCPASIVMGERYPDNSDPKYRDEGTACHEVASWCLDTLRGGPLFAAGYIGRRIDVDVGRTVEFTDSMAELTQTYVDNMRKYIATPGVEEVLIEQELPIGHITGEEGATGTADAVIIAGTEWQVHDAKFGRTPVEAVGNLQMMLYALGAIEEYQSLYPLPESFLLVIHQPKISSKPYEWRIYTAALLATEAPQFRDAATRVEAARATAKLNGPLENYMFPGEKQCGFCSGRAHCPAAAKRVEADLGAAFDVIADAQDDPFGNSLGDDVNPVSFDIETLAAKYAAIPFIESWCKAVAAAFESRLLAGETHPDWKVVQGRKGSRAWSDAEGAEKMLKEQFRLKVEEMYDLKLISPTSAEKLHKAGAIGPRQWPKLQALITQAEGEPSVAPSSDPRPALEIKPAADAFEALAPDTQAEEDLIG